MVERLADEKLLADVAKCVQGAFFLINARVDEVLGQRAESIKQGNLVMPTAYEFYPKDVYAIWQALIEATFSENRDALSNALYTLGGKISNLPGTDPDVTRAYWDLFSYAYFKDVRPHNPAAKAEVDAQVELIISRVFQNVEMINGLEVIGFDRKWYLEKAKELFLHSLENGRSDRIREDAAIALKRCRDDDEVRRRLTRALNDESLPPGVREYAVESIVHIRREDELDRAMADRDFLLETEYPEAGGKEKRGEQRGYIQSVYHAVETVLKLEKGDEPAEDDEDMLIAMVGLARFIVMPERIAHMFPSENDKQNLQKIAVSVENALLHIFTNGNSWLREEAAESLVAVKSERVREILEKIAKRDGAEIDIAFEAQCLLERMNKHTSETRQLGSIRSPRVSQPVKRPSGMPKDRPSVF